MNNRNQMLLASAIGIIFIIAFINFVVLRKPKNIEIGEDAQLIYVPISFGKIVSIARRPVGITIAFESGDIIVVRINTASQRHFKVIWR